MSKYDRLTRHLETAKVASMPMTFSEVEQLLGFALPPSARKSRSWWSNNTKNSVATKAWRAAGYQSRGVDMEAERLEFVRLNTVTPSPDASRKDHPLWGALEGMITIAPGVDLTDPVFTDAEMEAMLDHKARRIVEGMR